MLKVSEKKELLGVWGWKEINFSQGILEDFVFQLKKKKKKNGQNSLFKIHGFSGPGKPTSFPVPSMIPLFLSTL